MQDVARPKVFVLLGEHRLVPMPVEHAKNQHRWWGVAKKLALSFEEQSVDDCTSTEVEDFGT